MPNPEMRILVVDDMNTMRMIVRGLLRQLGYKNITEAEGGAHAMTLLRTQKFDLVLCDWNMPGVCGLEVLRFLRSSPGNAAVPFLMVTAEARKENVIEAARAGVSGYVSKPFTAQVLQEKLAKILKD